MEHLLQAIAKEIAHMYGDEMTTAEKNIAKLLEANGFLKKNIVEDAQAALYTYIPIVSQEAWVKSGKPDSKD